MNNLLLLRHGQSQWNKERRFTGWVDIDLTEQGKYEAEQAGRLIKNLNIEFDAFFTSQLKRAINTLKIVLKVLNKTDAKISKTQMLNERHYGGLTSLNKDETIKKYGNKQVNVWRRSYDIAPPSLSIDDKRHPKFNKKFKGIGCDLPSGESLKNVIDRLKPFWEEYRTKIATNPGNHLIIAHSNSLRAIVKILEKLSDKEIISINIPTGVPLVYELDENFTFITKEYLINKKELKAKQKIMLNQGKVK